MRHASKSFLLLCVQCFTLAGGLPAVHAESVLYNAREGSAYAGDLLESDSGPPTDPGLEGDTFVQTITYSQAFTDLLQTAVVTWDENVETLAGFTDNAFSLPFTARSSETILWTFMSGSWTSGLPDAVTFDGSTGGVERTPLIVPLFAPPPGGGSSLLTELELMELQMAGVDAAFQQYLDPAYDLSTVTHEQLEQDLRRLEAILAGNYSPPPYPEPATTALLGAGALLVLLRVRRRGAPSP